MRTACVIQARLGSTRLPGKVLMPICGKPMIQHVVERARAIKGVDFVGLTIPHDDLGEFNQLDCLETVWIGLRDEHDVLSGYASLAKEMKADVVMRITSDCPLTSPDICERVLRFVVEDGIRFSTNDTRSSGYPDGTDVECFTREILEEAHAVATDPQDREHVTRWMYRNVLSKVTVGLPGVPTWPKLSVDTQDDLDRVRRIMARIPAGDYTWAATQEAIRAELSEKS